MPEFKDYPRSNTRTLIDFDAVIENLGKSDIILCVDTAIVAIIRKLLRDRGLWRTTYVVEYGDIGYTIPTQAEFEPLRAEIANFLEETNTMNCEDFLTALETIANNIGLCCSPAGSGSYVDIDGEPYPGSVPPVDPPTSFGEGEEFESETAYDTHRCAAANRIVEGLIMSLNNWSILDLASIIAGGIVIALFVATPPLAVFIALAVAGIAFGALHSMANYIDSNREDWVCAIYNGDGFLDTLVAIDTEIAAMLTDLSLTAFNDQVTELFHHMLNTNVVNGLYEAFDLPTPISTPVDCGPCVPASCMVTGEVAGDYGIITDSYADGDNYVYECTGEVSPEASNQWRFAMQWAIDETPCNIEFVSAVVNSGDGVFVQGVPGITDPDDLVPPAQGSFVQFGSLATANELNVTLTVRNPSS